MHSGSFLDDLSDREKSSIKRVQFEGGALFERNEGFGNSLANRSDLLKL